MIEGISKLYIQGNFINLSNILDLTQQIEDSLLQIANHTDYKFSVNLGILAGKRDFLHFDQWL